MKAVATAPGSVIRTSRQTDEVYRTLTRLNGPLLEDLTVVLFARYPEIEIGFQFRAKNGFTARLPF